MRGVAKGVHYGGHLIADTLIEFDDIIGRDHQIFGKRAIAVNAHAYGVFAHMQLTSAAVTAMSASDMTFACDSVAHFKMLDAIAHFTNDTDVFMSDNHRRLYGFL